MRLRSSLALLALLTACRRTTPPPPATDTTAAPVSASASAASADSASPVASGSSSAEPVEPAPSTPDAALARASVQGDDIRRRTLFVWVTPEQATALRQTKLLADAFKAGGAPGLDAALKKAQDPTTLQLLRALSKGERRPFALAWSNVWGTSRRLDSGQLVQVTLRPDAVVGRFEPSRPKPWSFVDAKGQDVAPGKVMARPERLGAILHTTTGKAGEPVRGYALASESAITSWSMATPTLDAEIESAATLLAGLPPGDTPPEAWAARVTDAWKASAPSYEATLSTAAGYEPGQRPDLVARLRKAKASGAPLSVKVSAARGGAFADLLEEGVQRQICTEHGDKTRCTPQPPSRRRAHDGRFCTDEQGHMVDCPARR